MPNVIEGVKKNSIIVLDFENMWRGVKNIVNSILEQNNKQLPLPLIALDYYALMEKLREQNNPILMINVFPEYLYDDERADILIKLMERDGFGNFTSKVDNATCKDSDNIDSVLIRWTKALLDCTDHQKIRKIVIISDDADLLTLGTYCLNKGMEVVFMENYLMNKRIVNHKKIVCEKIPLQHEKELIEMGFIIPSNL